MDKLRALYDSYIEQGIISSETTFEEFSSADSNTVDILYKQGVENKAISSSTSFDVFKSTWADQKPVKQNAVAEQVTDVTAEEGVVTASELGLDDGLSESQKLSERNLLVFNIEETEKQINNYIAKGGEVNESDAKVLQQYKNDLIKFDRSDYSSRDFNKLKEEEKIKLLDDASEELIKDKGQKEYKISEAQVQEKAKDLLRDYTNPSLLSDYSARGVRGFSNFFKGATEFGDMVEFSLMDLALSSFDDTYTGSVKEKQALKRVAEGTGDAGAANISKAIGSFSEKLEPYIREYENESMIDDIKDGNYLLAGERAVGAAIESIPSIVAASYGMGGLVALASTSAGGKFSEEFEKDPKKNTGILVTNALATGAVEAGFEYFTRGVLRRSGLLKSTVNEKAAREFIAGGANSFIKNLGINTVSEAGSEGATKLTSLLVDKAILGRDVDLDKNWKSIAEEALVGSVFGVGATGGGAIRNTNANSVTAASNILMPAELKKVVQQNAKEISELNKSLENTTGESAEIIKQDIENKSRLIYAISNNNIESLENMSSEEINKYAKNKNKIESISSELKKDNLNESTKNSLEANLKKISEENKTLYKESVTRNTDRKFNADINNVSKALKSTGINVDNKLIFETKTNADGKVESTGEDQMKQWFIENNPNKYKKPEQIEAFAEENKGSYGAFTTDKNGKEVFLVNKDSATRDKVVTTGQHEFLHKLLKSALSKDKKLITNAGKTLLKEIESMARDTGQGNEFLVRVEQYRKDLENENNPLTEDQFYEEVLPLFSEALTRKDIVISRSNFQRINDFFRRIFQNLGIKKLNFKDADGIKNFILDYNKAFQKGKIKGKLKKLSKGDVEDSVTSFSKAVEIQSQIEALEDSYYDGEIDDIEYENRLSNLESKLEAAKKAPVEPKPVSKPKIKETEEEVKEVIKEASDEVFKEVEVSSKNKEISNKNEEIANEMLSLGANKISEIKDDAKRKAIIDKLGANNLGAVTNLAKKAAAVGKNLNLDKNLKIGYDEFFSGFSEELSALINTYKVEVDGKKVPFGAYMNKNLSLRYGQILDKAIQGRIKNSESLSSDSKAVKGITAETAGDFDAYTSADQGLPAGELIDVTEFRKVKDKVDSAKESIDLEGVDVGDLTYKKVVDDYAGPVGAAIIGLHDKNDAPDKGESRNKFQKLAERIDGTRTLNYGKDTGGEAEVRAMQSLFIDYNDALKFIKTLPEFNVAPFETTVDKQGKSVDLTTDARGYSVGTSNVILKQLYDVYIDPKAKSSDKDVKSRSITSPSGRGKGKTSQVAKVYRLKDKYRGRVSRATVKELQKTIGITEAGEAFIPMKGKNRTEFGTALQGLTKIYAANVANTIVRKDIVDKGITTDKKSTDKTLADIGGGKSSIMFSKNVEPVRSEKVYKKFEKDLKGFKLYHGGEISTSQNSNVSERNMLTWFWTNDFDGAVAHNQDDKSIPIYEVNFDDISGDKIVVPDFEYMPYTIIKEAVEKVYYKGYRPAPIVKDRFKRATNEMDSFSAPSVMSDPKANEIVKEFLDWSYKNNEAYEYNFGIPFVENGKIAEGLPVIVVGEIPSSKLNKVNQSSENANVLFSKKPTTSSLTDLFIDRAVAYVQPKTKEGKPTSRIGKTTLNKIITGLLYTESYEGRSEFLKAKEKLKDYQKQIVDHVFEGKDWMFGLFSDEQALNNGVKYEKLIRRAIKELKLKDVSIDLSQGGFGSGVDLVLSIKGKDINIELKLNKNAQFGSFSIKEEDGKYVYTEGVSGLKEKLPDLDTKIQKELNSEEYQENFKAFIDEALKNGGKLDNKTGKLTGPEKMFKHLVENDFLQRLNININKDSKGKELDEKIINLLYNNKDVYNIEIGGKGLYYLGKNKDNLPVPKLEGYTSLMIRQTYNQLGKSGVYALVNRAFLNIDSNIVESNVNFSDLNNIENAVETLSSSIGFSKKIDRSRLDQEFNNIIENKTGIRADDTFSEVKAKMIANKKRNFNIFIPPSAEDFVGLLYATLGKGKVGDKQMQFYERALLKPYSRAMEAIKRDRKELEVTFKSIKDQFKATPKDLKNTIPGGLFTKEQAVRVFIWDSIGKEVPGLSDTDVKELVDYVKSDKNLEGFAEQVMRLNPGSKYASPTDTWSTGNITTDLLEVLNNARRAKHLKRWQQNVDEIFSKENLNKLEAAYGTSYRKAMENMLTRMKTGRNRTYGTDTQTAKWIDWVNGSVGAIMFFNARSAVLQTLSFTNFINFGDNNLFAASKAFANQKQYWSDFSMLLKSDFLVDRRDGLKIDINEADIAEAARTKGVRGAINYLLQLGFTPTKFADSFAIALGGSTFYRNRLDALVKKGMDPLAAERQAMRDFIETAEESQQSSRPDKISQEQAGPLGRVILAFANTPAQYARIIKKAASDLKNGRGDAKTNISKIVYYTFAQNLLFNALQQALFAVTFGDEEDEENEEMFQEKKLNIINGMLDSVIRGTGITGAVFSVVKNMALKAYKESDKKNPNYEAVALEALKISPPISSKINKMRSASRTLSWDMDEIKSKGISLDNPALMVGAQGITAATNIPLDRVVRKVDNLKAASDAELETYKRLALVLGWSKWELGIKDKVKIKVKQKLKKNKTTGVKTRR